MKFDRDSLAFKLAVAPFLLLFFDTPAILVGRDGMPGFLAYIPLLILDCIVFLDIFTRRHSGNRDRFNRAILVLSFLAFPLVLAVPYLENELLWGTQIPAAVMFVGIAIEVFGGGLVICSRKVLGRYGTVDIVLEEKHVLITSGPYRYVRNPMYSGFMALIVGYSIAVGGYIASAVSLMLIFGVLHARTLLEERLLEGRFGEAYREYRKRTGRYLPRIPK